VVGGHSTRCSMPCPTSSAAWTSAGPAAPQGSSVARVVARGVCMEGLALLLRHAHPARFRSA
jgi:hypothetical protein